MIENLRKYCRKCCRKYCRKWKKNRYVTFYIYKIRILCLTHLRFFVWIYKRKLWKVSIFAFWTIATFWKSGSIRKSIRCSLLLQMNKCTIFALISIFCSMCTQRHIDFFATILQKYQFGSIFDDLAFFFCRFFRFFKKMRFFTLEKWQKWIFGFFEFFEFLRF